MTTLIISHKESHAEEIFDFGKSKFCCFPGDNSLSLRLPPPIADAIDDGPFTALESIGPRLGRSLATSVNV